MADETQKNSFLVLHPLQLGLYLIIGGMCALFLAFSAAYIYHRVINDFPPIKLPLLFYTNTLLLVGSNYTIRLANKAFINDETSKFINSLWGTTLFTVAFLVLQIIAWKQLLQSDIGFLDTSLSSFVYLISGLHFLHVIAGLPILITFLYVARRKLVDPVSVLMYYSSPNKKRNLEMLTIYWHFLDYLWIYLVVFFTINYWIG